MNALLWLHRTGSMEHIKGVKRKQIAKRIIGAVLDEDEQEEKEEQEEVSKSGTLFQPQ